MIPGDLAARLRMLTEASFFDSEPPVQGTAKVREIQARLPQLLPGQQFTANIQRSLPDGTFQAVVAGRSYTLALNHAAKAGDSLELIVTRSTPNAVFAQLANPAGTGAEAAVRPNLSPTGQLISFLLTGQPAAQATALAAGKPLVATPPVATSAPLAAAIRQAVAQSGLFYESHQLQWLSGKMDTAALQREPQSGFAQPRGAAPGGQGAAPQGAATPASSSATPQAQAGLARLAGNAAAITGISESAETDGSSERLAEALRGGAQARLAPVPERLMPLVHQQLDGMATQQYVLHGQAWPAQHFELTLEDPGQQGNGQGEDATDWNTTLRLKMPRLGSVEARLQLTREGVAIRLSAADAETATKLERGQAELASALEAADLPLLGFVVERTRNE